MDSTDEMDMLIESDADNNNSPPTTQRKPDYDPTEMTLTSRNEADTPDEKLAKIRAEWDAEKQQTKVFPFTVREEISHREFEYPISPPSEPEVRKVPVGRILLYFAGFYIVSIGLIYALKAIF